MHAITSNWFCRFREWSFQNVKAAIDYLSLKDEVDQANNAAM